MKIKNILRKLDTKNLPLVLYGYETLPLTLSEEHRLREFKNRVIKYFSNIPYFC
jgi:hypothetical protein